jgi:hypothetical protein
VVGEIATLETKAAFLDLARSSCGYRHLTNFTSVAQPGGLSTRGPAEVHIRAGRLAGAGAGSGARWLGPSPASMLGRIHLSLRTASRLCVTARRKQVKFWSWIHQKRKVTEAVNEFTTEYC